MAKRQNLMDKAKELAKQKQEAQAAAGGAAAEEEGAQNNGIFEMQAKLARLESSVDEINAELLRKQEALAALEQDKQAQELKQQQLEAVLRAELEAKHQEQEKGQAALLADLADKHQEIDQSLAALTSLKQEMLKQQASYLESSKNLAANIERRESDLEQSNIELAQLKMKLEQWHGRIDTMQKILGTDIAAKHRAQDQSKQELEMFQVALREEAKKQQEAASAALEQVVIKEIEQNKAALEAFIKAKRFLEPQALVDFRSDLDQVVQQQAKIREADFQKLLVYIQTMREDHCAIAAELAPVSVALGEPEDPAIFEELHAGVREEGMQLAHDLNILTDEFRGLIGVAQQPPADQPGGDGD